MQVFQTNWPFAPQSGDEAWSRAEQNALLVVMKLRHLWQNILVAMLLTVTHAWPAVAEESPTYAQLIDQADEKRTSDPGAFVQLVHELQERIGEATPLQRQMVRYFECFLKVYQGDPATANAELAQLFQEVTDVDLRFRVGAFLSSTYTSRGDQQGFTDSYRTLNEVLQLADQVSDQVLLQQGLLNATVVLNAAGQYQETLRYAERILENAKNPRTICGAMLVRSEAEYRLQRLSGDDALNAAIRQCAEAGEAIMENYGRLYLARKWRDEGNIDAAIVYINEALPAVLATGYTWLIVEFHAVMAEMLLNQGRLDEAQKHAEAATAAIPEKQHIAPLVLSYRVLYDIAKLRGETDKALFFHEKYALSDKVNLDDVRVRALAYQQARFESEEKDRQIAYLGKANEVLQLQREVERQTARNTRLLLAFLLSLLGSVAFWSFRIKRSQLAYRRRVETDPLTRAYSRQHFASLCEAALQSTAPGDAPVSLVLFDLDNFKAINDHYGHPTGDWVLKTVVARCREVLGPHEPLGRLGGEEFAILLVGLDREAARQRADLCRQVIAQTDTTPIGASFPVSASFGVADTHTAGRWFGALIAQADALLYQSKRAGRNRVSVAEVAAA